MKPVLSTIVENQHVEDSHPCLISLTLIGCGPDYASVADGGGAWWSTRDQRVLRYWRQRSARDDEPQDDDHNAPHRDDEREPNTDERDPDRTEQPPANPAPENDCKGSRTPSM